MMKKSNNNRIVTTNISNTIKEYLEKNNLSLNDIFVNLLNEKIFNDRKEYTIEIFRKNKHFNSFFLNEKDINFIESVLRKLLKLMYFNNFDIEKIKNNNETIFKIKTNNKDGLLIGKNGQNILALQYILTVIIEKNLKKHMPIILEVDNYREKRINILKTMANELAQRALTNNSDILTEFLPPFERKIVHDEINNYKNLKTISLGKNTYKKILISPFL